MSAAAHLMDRVYARQRHIYDATRKFYLLGRDELIAELDPPAGGRVLEIACGTARNLIAIARRYPGAACYGLDVSAAMLSTARRSVAREGLAGRIHLGEADATTFDPSALFGIRDFDRVVISYALSMIPPWQEAMRRASEMLAPGGSLHIVDFGDQARMPPGFKPLLEAWLARFHVEPRPALAAEVERLAALTGLRTSTRPRYRGYAIAAELLRPDARSS